MTFKFEPMFNLKRDYVCFTPLKFALLFEVDYMTEFKKFLRITEGLQAKATLDIYLGNEELLDYLERALLPTSLNLRIIVPKLCSKNNARNVANMIQGLHEGFIEIECHIKTHFDGLSDKITPILKKGVWTLIFKNMIFNDIWFSKAFPVMVSYKVVVFHNCAFKVTKHLKFNTEPKDMIRLQRVIFSEAYDYGGLSKVEKSGGKQKKRLGYKEYISNAFMSFDLLPKTLKLRFGNETTTIEELGNKNI